ncbi:MAG: hypothetical protein WC938_00450 [Candidatus Paceibacterota bacterium]|jgi:hypothetical protein
MNWKEFFSRWIRLMPLVIIILFGPIIMFFSNADREDIAIFIALEFGILGILQIPMSETFISPLFNCSIREVVTKTDIGENQKYYHLSIRNYGFISAKNVKVKIRDDENKGWINLTLPFRKILEEKGKDATCMENLSPGEENQFDLGFIDSSEIFSLMVNIYPFSEKTAIKKKDSQLYFIEVTADNTNPHRFKMDIENNGYSSLLINVF